MITRSFELATDDEFRLLAGITSPPRAGVVTDILPSGQLVVALDETDGGAARAWPLNGWHYPVGAVVYVVFAADSPESGIVLGTKGGMALQVTGKRVGLFDAAANSQGMLHAHDGVGGLICVTLTGIDNATPRVLIPDGGGDVVRGLAYQIVVSDGAGVAATAAVLTPGASQDYVAGSLTVRVICSAAGALTVHRQSGTGSASLALLGVWL